jgi:hypothetical protein
MKSYGLLLATIAVLILPSMLFAQDAAPRPIQLPPTSPSALIQPQTVEKRNARIELSGESPTSSSNRIAKVMTAQRFAATKDQIRFLNPSVSAETLKSDELVVHQAISEVTNSFKQEGFDETDAEEAVLAAWFYLRIGRVIEISLSVLLGSTDDLGKVVINSDPDQAEIAVEGQPTGSRTLYKTWLPAGTYKIGLSKPGYAAQEDKCEIVKRRKTEFTKTLTRQP